MFHVEHEKTSNDKSKIETIKKKKWNRSNVIIVINTAV